MRTILIFVAVYILSSLAAYAAGRQIADFFFLQDEFTAVLMALMIFSSVAIAAFAAAYVLVSRARPLGYVAIALAVVAVVIEELPVLAEAFAKRSTNPVMIGDTQINAIAATMLVPTAVMLLIQWPLIRRRWLVARGAEYRSAGRGSQSCSPASWASILSASSLLARRCASRRTTCSPRWH
jgi:hypothetical protein